MSHHRKDADKATVPLASPDPAGNTGYAEDKPKDKAQAHIPGGRPAPDAEEGDLEHAPNPRN